MATQFHIIESMNDVKRKVMGVSYLSPTAQASIPAKVATKCGPGGDGSLSGPAFGSSYSKGSHAFTALRSCNPIVRVDRTINNTLSKYALQT